MPNLLYDALFAPHQGSSKPLLYLKDGAVVSYDAFLRQAARIANALTDHGVKPGDRVAVQVRKSAEALALYAACIRSGAIFLPLNTAYMPNEVEYFVGNARPALVVCDSDAHAALAPIAKAAGARLLTLDGDGKGTLTDEAERCSDHFETVPRGADDLAALLYTSGTTGRSKGAMLTQANLLSNARSLVEAWRFTDKDVLLHALPIFHTHGLFVACNVTLLAGGAMIFLPSFQVDEIIEYLPRATSMMGVPTFYTRLLDDPRFTKDLTRHMRLFTSGSAPLLAETHVAFEARTGHRILERYGMTETNMTTSNPYEGERRAGTVGFALPDVEIRVVDPETKTVLPDSEIGILEVRGPNVFKGYWEMPEKTREEFRDDGFFITGDVVSIDKDGYVQIVGRAKDLIISGGFNIYPKEVELLLDEQEGVLESAVIGVPHPDFGEGVVGVVVPQKDGSLDEQSLLAAIHDRIARFKQPKRIFTVDELPRNTMGKVQKNILRDRFAGTFQAK
ncbi:malonate--CoA ligase [Manganibacter manganicus]|uniref:Malonyl-CoA synthase n=1 Tax=Manganibacter manganicus TaxID=1873176 RepID=A0A1V8RMP1_9HYPH|nr:malonyl-CoA synthase [Pseudaminobacter manganicus]OQM74249.1 malonyl-CoA synthase [Pseudaminobacter manganicus]